MRCPNCNSLAIKTKEGYYFCSVCNLVFTKKKKTLFSKIIKKVFKK